ncbi:aminopeptidase N [Pseudoteredinibacter isoporae]|uniref:Aminopeptidase N n=1 Tax=Pseudoteredinibacter isoporae TaxID=570281 RepID=A0A7X0JTN2_9GAMM|nr:aminopeptidase N [Pseudoteredinibacter isoporae]NHO87192.1 aminopeptidase N [Pseudoteredinibacter isoporae]NIB23016.1 aminopeptidase N [Pseudoteredinibacter isoporae]
MSNKTIYLKDYRAPAYWIDRTDLYVDLHDGQSKVSSRLSMQVNPDASIEERQQLQLHGRELVLESVELDGKPLTESDYEIDDEYLTLPIGRLLGEVENDELCFDLTIVTLIEPEKNTSLEGLYRSSSMYCTQCEAEGFRKITYYLDRPDVMSEFFTSIEADANRYPVMLSNGNKIEDKQLDNGRRLVRWHDPFKKPAYLFALVAGDLECVEDHFVTMTGREILLQIFVEAKDLDKCQHAMESLKNSMRWDEEVYGREYDLDIFMIVAVDDFNMGAMENKGLNIFNTSCVLAKAETTTDAGFQRVEGVVAHEYFHNWSGNRVTCRDWFQLSLKEGFTVFRDAQFSSDMGSETVKRVEDVSLLRSAQFAEDGGPLAHAVRPASFIEISNFYTLTIYEKGAEIVRMLHTLLGAETFRKGSDLYFHRHDGQAVTVEDFVAAMADVSGRDFSQFMNWYRQAGTPELTISEEYDEDAREYRVTIEQYCRPTPESSEKAPYHIPLNISLWGEAGALAIRLKGQEPDFETEDNTQTIIELHDQRTELCFMDVPERPVFSFLRGFSAPVKVHFKRDNDQLLRLMRNESDGFSRWDACQQLLLNAIAELETVASNDVSEQAHICEPIAEAFWALLQDETADPAMIALMLSLPSLTYLIELRNEVQLGKLDRARETLRLAIANRCFDVLWNIYQDYDHNIEYKPEAEQIAMRSLKNTALAYLMLAVDQGMRQGERGRVLEACAAQYEQANNMTDQLAALQAMLNAEYAAERADTALEAFYDQWQSEALVMNLWLQVQAVRRSPNALSQVRTLKNHPAFDSNNPNKIRSLIGAFCGQNLTAFHASDSEGVASSEAYDFLASEVLNLDQRNPQIAARLLVPLTRWHKFSGERQALMKKALQNIANQKTLSKDVRELVEKSL